MLGKNTGRNLWSPHRLSSLKGIAVRSVVSGCMSCHSVIITAEGKVYSWGMLFSVGQLVTTSLLNTQTDLQQSNVNPFVKSIHVLIVKG